MNKQQHSNGLCDPFVLVVPPAARVARTPLGASLLKTRLESRGHRVILLNHFIDYATRIGILANEWLVITRSRWNWPEFIFAAVLYNKSPEEIRAYVDEVIIADRTFYRDHTLSMPPKSLYDTIGWFVDHARDHVSMAVNQILAINPQAVGFSLTTSSNCAALALADRLKKENPDIATIFGGSYCVGEIGAEYFKRFSTIDYLIDGEADIVLPQLLDMIKGESPMQSLPGVHNSKLNEPFIPKEPVCKAELNQLPGPDYTDYFASLKETGLDEVVSPVIMAEGSRGCWWGDKRPCLFCGNPNFIKPYREKASQKFLDEVRILTENYPKSRIYFVDLVLAAEHIDDVFPRFADEASLSFFGNIRVELKKEQIRKLGRAGAYALLPGIETFNDHDLKIINKGATSLQNVFMLKLFCEYGINPRYNYLYAIPGQKTESVREDMDFIKLIHHLQPPDFSGSINFWRFSEYVTEADAHKITNLSPSRSYNHIFPFEPEGLTKVAWDFISPGYDEWSTLPVWKQVEKGITKWQKSYWRSHLIGFPRKKAFVVIDTRSVAKRLVHKLTGLEKQIIEYCDEIRSVDELTEHTAATRDEVQAALDTLLASRLMIRLKDTYLSLVVNPFDSYRRVRMSERDTGKIRFNNIEAFLPVALIKHLVFKKKRLGALAWTVKVFAYWAKIAVTNGTMDLKVRASRNLICAIARWGRKTEAGT